MSVEDKIIAIVAEQAFLDPKDVTQASILENLGIDSLGVVECIFAIEEAFDIQVPFNANNPEATAFDVSTVQSITAAVRTLIAEQKT